MSGCCLSPLKESNSFCRRFHSECFDAELVDSYIIVVDLMEGRLIVTSQEPPTIRTYNQRELVVMPLLIVQFRNLIDQRGIDTELLDIFARVPEIVYFGGKQISSDNFVTTLQEVKVRD